MRSASQLGRPLLPRVAPLIRACPWHVHVNWQAPSDPARVEKGVDALNRQRVKEALVDEHPSNIDSI